MLSGCENHFTISIPAWDDGETVEIKVRRPSLLTMAAAGEIPNELVGAAQRIFGGEPPTALPLERMGQLMIMMARAAMVEPTYDQMCESCGSMTDMQLAAVYSFTQAGVRALLPFRDGAAGAESAGDVQEVCGTPQ